MSRSKRKGKPPGYEYWSRRPGSNHGGSWGIGRESKLRTHRAERRIAKTECVDWRHELARGHLKFFAYPPPTNRHRFALLPCTAEACRCPCTTLLLLEVRS